MQQAVKEMKITVIGGGLAGCEAAFQVAERGLSVDLFEMKPHVYSPAHSSPELAELVCSNSLRGASLDNAVGLLKEELRRLRALTIRCADATQVPAGGALAVDRLLFSSWMTEKIAAHPRIRLHRAEQIELPSEGIVIVATGPLTSDSLATQLALLTGEQLYFYDAIAPVVTGESIDPSVVFAASRYGKGDGDDYLNAPFTREEYDCFISALLAAEKVPTRNFEKLVHFEGCMPVEELAARGYDTLRFGPMKPVGLLDPRTGQEPYAVVQLRMENRAGTLYNLVGFQTKLTWPEQKKVFRLIPGLQEASFARLGAMHRNTYINAPSLLLPTQQLKSEPRILFAGQITGVEGYVESMGSGYLAGITAAFLAKGYDPPLPPEETALAALVRYITESDPGHYQPSNVNYGLFPPLPGRIKKKERRALLAERALAALGAWQSTVQPAVPGMSHQ